MSLRIACLFVFSLSLMSLPCAAADEITRPTGQRSTVPPDVVVFNPAFDVTPADLVTAIITDHGVIEAPTRDRIASTLGSSKAVC